MQKPSRLPTAFKWGIALATAFVVAPIIFTVIQGMVGLAVAGIVGFGIIQAAPWASLKLSNFFMGLMKSEARKNPVETMQNLYRQRQEALAKAEAQIRAFNGKVQTYSVQVDKMKAKYPDEAQKFIDHLTAMHKLKDSRYAKLKAAEKSLDEYYATIQKASAIWEMSQAANDMADAAGLLSEGDAIQRIQNDEALNSVAESMANSFAELEHMLMTEVDDAGTKVLTMSEVETFESTARVVSSQKDKVYRGQ